MEREREGREREEGGRGGVKGKEGMGGGGKKLVRPLYTNALLPYLSNS